MISRTTFCSAQAAVMRPARTDAVHLLQAIRLCLDDIEHLVAEGAQELLGIDRANAGDHSRGEVLLDALDRCRSGGFEEPGFELLTVGAVVDPVAARCDPLAGRDRRSMADQGDQLAVATGLDPDDAKAILGVLVGDALDQSGERLVIGWRGLALHDGSHSGPISKRCDITGRTRQVLRDRDVQ